jgi:hypothetical protein
VKLNDPSLTRRLMVAVGTMVLVVLGLLTLWEIANRLRIKGDAIAVLALLFPLLVYLVRSGRLTELSGPGGLNAKFRQASGQPADEAAIEVSEAPLAVGKASLEDLETWLKTSAPDRSRPVLLSLVEGSAYDGPVFRSYLQCLRNEFPRFVFVTVLDREGKLVVHYPASVVSAWNDSSTPYLITMLNAVQLGNRKTLAAMPSARTEPADPTTSLSHALAEMRKLQTEFLLVANRSGRPYGILDRGAALSALLAPVTN